MSADIYFTTKPPACTCSFASYAYPDGATPRHAANCELRCTAIRTMPARTRYAFIPFAGERETVQFEARCVLEAGHTEPHYGVAVDGNMVVWSG